MSDAAKQIPSARISVSILRDPDYIALITRGERSRAAFTDYVHLLIVAKDRGNSGRFQEPLEVTATALRISTRQLSDSIGIITRVCKSCNSKPWVVVEDGSIVIRNWRKWNDLGRGGVREGAGRPVGSKNKSKQSKDINEDSLIVPHSGIGNGSYSYDSSQEKEIEAEDELIRSGNPSGPVTNSERSGIVGVSMAAYLELPPERQKSKAKFTEQWILAVRRGASSLDLAAALSEYYLSPVGRGQFAFSAVRFLEEDCYEDNRAAWSKAESSEDVSLGGAKTLMELCREADELEY